MFTPNVSVSIASSKVHALGNASTRLGEDYGMSTKLFSLWNKSERFWKVLKVLSQTRNIDKHCIANRDHQRNLRKRSTNNQWTYLVVWDQWCWWHCCCSCHTSAPLKPWFERFGRMKWWLQWPLVVWTSLNIYESLDHQGFVLDLNMKTKLASFHSISKAKSSKSETPDLLTSSGLRFLRFPERFLVQSVKFAAKLYDPHHCRPPQHHHEDL